MRFIFGWDYPPGVSSLPWDEDYPCDVCGQYENDCICPECPECSMYGDPYCYIHHGLRRTEEQKFLLECTNRFLLECANREMEDYIKDMEKYCP